MEQTYIMVKPDGVERRLVGEIIRRFENRGLKLVGLKLLTPTREIAEVHYAVHREKPFFGELVEFVTSGPVVAMIWEGNDVVALTRQMIGATKPINAQPGTIRGDYTSDILSNLIHGSDSADNAAAEIALWFG
jgi:nucleoside-diphosphate kinase